MPKSAVITPASRSSSQIETWIAGAGRGRSRRSGCFGTAHRAVATRPASGTSAGTAATRTRRPCTRPRVEGDVAEVEQACVADDDVQADGHHHEHEHVDAGRDVRPHAEHRDREHLSTGRTGRGSPPRSRRPAAPTAVRVRDPEDGEGDREQRRRATGALEDQEDQDEDDLRRELPRERRQPAIQ